MARSPQPQFSFADLEFLRQSVFLDPKLQVISKFLDAHGELVEQVREDLERGLKNPATGRQGLTAAQVLRSLVLQRIKNWDFRELRERIADGYTLRGFTDFFSQPVPKHDAFNRAFRRLRPETLEAINEAVVQAAVAEGLEHATKLRVDTTVVETNIHHPTDSGLLWDTVRVVNRLVKRLRKFLPEPIDFADRTRSARRRMQELARMTARQRHTQQVPRYRALIGIAEEVVEKARGVLTATEAGPGLPAVSALKIARLREGIAHYCGLGDRVIDQARRRVLQGEVVPTDEKIFSLFEPHTDLIKRGKVLKPVEFGHKVFLAESAHGLITQYRVLDGNPNDDTQVEPSLQRHLQSFGRAPELYGADRGFHSGDNVNACSEAGVAIVSIPQRGGKKTAEQVKREKSPAFKRGQRFRAGIEGRISVLFRGRGMKRCFAEGPEGFEQLVGTAVLANNLLVIAGLTIQRQKRRRRVARAA